MKSILSNIRKYSSSLMTMPSFSGHTKVAIDLGTSMTRIAIEGKGIVLREPTFVAHNTKTSQAMFIGEDAKNVYGKAPDFIKVIKPIENSIISDFDGTVALMQTFLKKSVYPYYHSSFIRKGLAAYSVVPTTSTEVEQKALKEAFIKAGFQKAYFIERPIAAAIGADSKVFTNKPVFIIDIGAGSVEIAIIIMGGIVSSKVLKVGGDHMDKLIYNYLHLKYGLIIGEQTSEELKNDLFRFDDKKAVKTIRGKSLENGLPKSVRVTSSDIKEALVVPINAIIDGIKEIIETSPPEIIDGLIKSGAILTGNLARIPYLDSFIMNDVKIPITVAKKPQDATILGIYSLFDNKELLERCIMVE